MKILAQRTLVVLVLWLSVLTAYAQTVDVKPSQPAKVEQIEVTDFGIYTADKTASTTNDLGLTHNIVNNIQYIAATDTIRAQLGVKFGFRYSIRGAPEDARVTIKQITIYPPAGVMSPKTGLLQTHSFSTVYRIGMSGVFAGYDINEPWEQVPGTWTIQLWVGDQKFAEHSFAVIADAASEPPAGQTASPAN
jgi:hypothetical protein